MMHSDKGGAFSFAVTIGSGQGTRPVWNGKTAPEIFSLPGTTKALTWNLTQI